MTQAHRRHPVAGGRRAALALALTLTGATAAAATLELRPGLWQFRTQVWINGQEILEPLDRAAAEIIARTRAGMTAAERAEFDRSAPPTGQASTDTECIPESESRMDARAALQQAMRSVHQPPWSCTFRDERAGADGVSFLYDCKTAAGGKADGRAAFRLSSPSTQLTTIEGRAHVVNGQGVPQGPELLPVKLRSEGRWIAETCPLDSGDEPDEADQPGADADALE
jgi:hypothetical protein